jgi:hypothetical protein
VLENAEEAAAAVLLLAVPPSDGRNQDIDISALTRLLCHLRGASRYCGAAQPALEIV